VSTPLYTRRLGCVPDKRDGRDRLFCAHPARLAPVPEFASVDVASIAPKDQGRTSSCVGNAWAQALRLAYLAAGMPCPDLSALAIYRGARNLDGTTGDEGTQLRSGAQAIQLDGACSEDAWPFDGAAVDAQLPFAALRDAADRMGLRGYHRITDGSIDEMLVALAAGFPLAGGWTVSEDFVRADGRELFGPQLGLTPAGGHAMAVVRVGPSDYIESVVPGFKADQHYPKLGVLLGSWGSSYGYNGRIVVRPELLAEVTDCWAAQVAP
jgi:hypothetical protein